MSASSEQTKRDGVQCRPAPQSACVLVRAHNDMRFIARTLNSIAEQDCALPFRVYVCDDGSTDGTAEALRTFPDVVSIARPAGKYRPGRPLNHMVRNSEGDVVVFCNADAPPVGRDWLQRLISPLLDGTADATFASQLPRPNAQWLVRKDHLRAFGDGTISAKWDRFFSLASSAALRSDLLGVPFDESLRYSEDVDWVRRRKPRVVYVPDAKAEHSHNYGFAELKRRFYGEGQADMIMFGRAPGVFRALAGALAETARDWLFLLPHPSGWKELPIAPARRLIQRLSYWKGARDAGKEKRNGS